MKRLTMILLVEQIFMFALSLPIAAQQIQPAMAYTVTDLDDEYVGRISNNGWMTGTSTGPLNTEHAFLWRNGKGIDLGTIGNWVGFSYGRGVNDAGDVVGVSETPVQDPYAETYCNLTAQACLPFVWRRNLRRMVPLPTLGGTNGTAVGINHRGEVVGSAESGALEEIDCQIMGPHFQNKPVIWRNGRVHELPTYPGDPDGWANSVNDRGWAVGASGVCFLYPHALLWKGGQVIDLGNLGGTFTWPTDINNHGQIVGVSEGGDFSHAFLWQNGAMTDLGTLPGDVDSTAYAINNHGQVVGESTDAYSSNPSAVVWQNGVIADLNSLIPAGSPLFLLSASDINDRGQIIGSALDIATGRVHAFLAMPSGATVEREGESHQSRKITVPEDVRRQLQQRDASRMRIDFTKRY